MVSRESIYSFEGKYAFLSNFHPASIVMDGKLFPSTEHAYQALKTFDMRHRECIRLATTPDKAKKLGKKIRIRKDWWQVKLRVMEKLVFQKFRRNVDLKKKLLDTGEAVLVEGNTWGDRFFGVCNGGGYNHLGKILMKVRKVLRKEESA